MSAGERLATFAGPTAVLGIQPQHTAGQQTPQTVYNLEVQGQHVFRVTSNGLLVHNSYADDIAKLADDTAKQSFGKAPKGLPNPGSARFNQLQSLKNRLRNLGPRDTSVRGTNKTLAEITSVEADHLGKAFVGGGHRVNSAGFLISKNGTRLYRQPSLKPGNPFSNTGKQANYVIREFDELTGKWKHISNGHIDILD